MTRRKNGKRAKKDGGAGKLDTSSDAAVVVPPKRKGYGRSSELHYTFRRLRVARLYLEGKRQKEIAEIVEVDQSTISRDLEAIRQAWLRSTILDFNTIKAEQLARIDHLEMIAYRDYEASVKPVETITQKEERPTLVDGKQEKGATTITQRKHRAPVGDRGYLDIVKWCISERSKIYGIYEAIKLQIEDWRTDVVSALKNGQITAEEVKALYPDIADEFFALAGVQEANDS